MKSLRTYFAVKKFSVKIFSVKTIPVKIFFQPFTCFALIFFTLHRIHLSPLNFICADCRLSTFVNFSFWCVRSRYRFRPLPPFSARCYISRYVESLLLGDQSVVISMDRARKAAPVLMKKMKRLGT